DELRAVAARHAPRRVIFRDPVWAHDLARAETLCRLILEDRALQAGGRLAWECESRPDQFPAPLLRAMALAGCVGIKVGLETTDAGLLARHGRVVGQADAAHYLARAGALVRGCARYGIACRLYVMVGLPGQTAAMARETAGWVAEARPASLTIKEFVAYPGLRLTAEDCPAPDDVAAQAAPLEAVQRDLAAHPVVAAPRWLRRLRRRWWRLALPARRGG
ncbi:MAG: hypothetical protein V1772_02715, partial [Chloroflexota bacterium]